MVEILRTILTLVLSICVAFEFFNLYTIVYHVNQIKVLEEYHQKPVPEVVFKNYGVNLEQPKYIKLQHDTSFFKDFSNKIIKLSDWFRQIHMESIPLFEDVTSMDIFPYCIPAVAYTNNEICFRNTKIYNLKSLKLVNIELGRSSIHKKKKSRFLYITHKFDELVMNGTIDFEEASSQDTYNTSIRNGNLMIYRDYEYPKLFTLEIHFPDFSTGAKNDKYIAHAVNMQLNRAHEMIFNLPEKKLKGLLNLIENEINIPSVFFPENINFDCSDFPENDITKAREMHISTKDLRFNKRFNNDVINSVEFSEFGDNYSAKLSITFNELTFTSKMSVKLNGILSLNEDVLVKMDKLHIEVSNHPNCSKLFNVSTSILNGLSLSAEKKIDSYYYTPHFKGKLSNCIKATTVHTFSETLHSLKLMQIVSNDTKSYYLPNCKTPP